MIEVIGILVFLYFCFNIIKHKDDIFEKIRDCITGGLLVIFICLTLSPILSIFISPIEINRGDCKGNIYSLRSNNEVSGSFILGSGSFSGSEYYYMYQKK